MHAIMDGHARLGGEDQASVWYPGGSTAVGPPLGDDAGVLVDAWASPELRYVDGTEHEVSGP